MENNTQKGLYEITIRKAKNDKVIVNEKNLSFGRLMHTLNMFYVKYDGYTIDEKYASMYLGLAKSVHWAANHSKLIVDIKHAA